MIVLVLMPVSSLLFAPLIRRIVVVCSDFVIDRKCCLSAPNYCVDGLSLDADRQDVLRNCCWFG